MMRRTLGNLKNVVVYGGCGGLGRAVVAHFAAASGARSGAEKWRVVSVDLSPSDKADTSVVVTTDAPWESTSKKVRDEVQAALGGEPLDAVVNVAGGWAGGGIKDDGTIAACELMWKQSVHSSIISGQLAAHLMRPQGLLVLPGAAGAVGPTPGMLGYGVAKAAVHHILRSLADPESGLPKDVSVLGVLPTVLNTEMNRKFMPKANHANWTPLEFVAELVFDWAESAAKRPPTGSLVQMDTLDGKTGLSIVELSATVRSA
eukprot:TRINITY_DN55260_c0_g1_i1.p2 TRINITY_DN55260_c0_g1~~TRINITY_DN55260_c0_g1_i1.p2  ORF type:complete len:291 (+),score=113.54 TRINITY_DN55260_c0_g1_i1:94-873(+)